ncbi:HD domain-containing protein [Chitinimonas lacunae]|uniref:N-methyl-D-aspartate receptor NMDAR2C subunit n=1 Tax=Chitinimonas lacunae TaxID=1963018 RepID=A0ABV8MUN7_9NEIS
MTMLEQWHALWRSLGAEAGDEAEYRRLLTAYAEPQRHYHTRQHLDECLHHLAETRSLALHPAEVELALWYHDAVYQPRQPDNEARSADWAVQALQAQGIDQDVAGRVRALIMATCHQALPQEPDAMLLVDIDLAILAAPAERFAEYQTQVRAEYRWVPGFLFRRKRAEILRAFLARPRLFQTDWFFSHYEAQARANLAQELAVLTG